MEIEIDRETQMVVKRKRSKASCGHVEEPPESAGVGI
jgi:hypothetical protein